MSRDCIFINFQKYIWTESKRTTTCRQEYNFCNLSKKELKDIPRERSPEPIELENFITWLEHQLLKI